MEELPRPASPLVTEWKRRAVPAWRNMVVVCVMQGLALLFGVISPALPWEVYTFTTGGITVGGTTFRGTVAVAVGALSVSATCTGDRVCDGLNVKVPNAPAFGGAIIIFIGCAFIFAATIVSGVAATRLRALATTGQMPSPAGCCQSSVCCINGMGFTGFSVVLLGFTWAGIVCGAISYVVSASGASAVVGPGLALCAASIVLCLAASILGAVTGCQLGPLPAIGEAGCCSTAGAVVSAGPPGAIGINIYPNPASQYATYVVAGAPQPPPQGAQQYALPPGQHQQQQQQYAQYASQSMQYKVPPPQQQYYGGPPPPPPQQQQQQQQYYGGPLPPPPPQQQQQQQAAAGGGADPNPGLPQYEVAMPAYYGAPPSVGVGDPAALPLPPGSVQQY